MNGQSPDINERRIEELRQEHDRTHEVDRWDLSTTKAMFTNEAETLQRADFFIVTVPTPIDSANQPDFGAIRSASQIVGRALRPGAIVVYESTV